jgi:hypothetical protein
VPGAEVQEGDFVTVSATAWREAGLGVEADAARGQVLLYIENRTTRPLVVPAGEIGLLITQTGQE